MADPLVSIIIPNYNKEKYVARCLDSLADQTYPNTEIIFIDDCSTDRSIEIARSYKNRLNQLKIIINPVNMGVSVSRNIGLINATGKYITTLDSDDEYLPNKIEDEIKVLEDCETSKCVAYSDIVVRYRNKDVLLLPKIHNEDNALNIILFRKRAIPTYFMLHKTSIDNLEYGFDRTLQKYEDWDLLIRILNEAKLIYSGSAGIIYHQQNTGLSRGSVFNHIYWTSTVFLKNYKTTSRVKRLFGLYRIYVSLVVNKVRLLR